MRPVRLAGPEGPVVLPGMRMFPSHWEPDPDYRMHRHPPEAVDLPLAGSGHFRAEGVEAHWAAAGDYVVDVFDRSNQPHATIMGSDGVFALVLWRGHDLAVDLAMTPREAAA